MAPTEPLTTGKLLEDRIAAIAELVRSPTPAVLERAEAFRKQMSSRGPVPLLLFKASARPGGCFSCGALTDGSRCVDCAAAARLATDAMSLKLALVERPALEPVDQVVTGELRIRPEASARVVRLEEPRAEVLAPSPVKLRPYQVGAVRGLRQSFGQGKKRVLLVLPTGGGKTSIAAEVIRGAVAKGRRVVFLAHRKELIDQSSARLDSVNLDHGVILSGHKRARPALPIQVASVQTLVRREVVPFDLVIIDEAHHARANSYETILEDNPNAWTLGLTATPWRPDGKGLAELFEDLVVGSTVKQLTDLGFLVPFEGFSYTVPDLSKVHTIGGDYNEGELAEVVNTRKIVGDLVGRWQERASGLLTVAFAVNVAHSKTIVERFLEAGVAAEHLDGTTPREEREAILGRLRSGQTRLLANCNIVSEGFDLPDIGCVLLARPTKSVGLYLQQVGRGLRPAPGKDRLRIHDHAGSLLAHGLPDEDRDYSLLADTKKKPGAGVLRTCPDCFAVYPAGAGYCPQCGVVNEASGEKGGLEEVEDGVELSIEQIRERREKRHAFAATATTKDKAREYLRLIKVADERGYKRGWASHVYKVDFGDWPRWTEAQLEGLTPAERPFFPPSLRAPRKDGWKR